MEYLILTISFILIIGGLIGSFLPVLPGPTLSWIGLLCFYFTKGIPFNYWVLSITLLATITVTILDYIIPAQGTKKLGGSNYGVWGTNIGLVLGIFVPIPLAVLICPFVGAFIGEIIYNSKDSKRALKAALGSFIGFLASTFIKFVVCIIFLWIYIREIYLHWSILF